MARDRYKNGSGEQGDRFEGEELRREYPEGLPMRKKEGKVRLNVGVIVTGALIVAILVVVILIARDILQKRSATPQIREMDVPHSVDTATDARGTAADATPLPLRPESAGEGLLPVFYSANTTQNRLAVTVSGTLTESQMGKLISTAAQLEAKLTFFPTGEALEKNVPMWAQVNLMGHEIESAGYSGRRYLTMDGAAEIGEDLEKACAALRDWINADYRLHFLRTNDLYDDEYLLLHRAMSEKGFYGVARQAVQLSRQVTDEDIHAGMIVNMEIGTLSADDLCRYLEHLDSLGYTLVTMNELFEYPPNYVSSAGDEE